MQCSQCQQENPASANFCLNCGARQTKVCPQCQQALPPEARFCSACGQAVTGQPATATPAAYTPTHLAERIRAELAALEARAAADGERKTITALFADLKGSTALIEGQDPEVARAILDPALRIMMDSVHHFEGYVAQALGDGIFALFGAPLALEDHLIAARLGPINLEELAEQLNGG